MADKVIPIICLYEIAPYRLCGKPLKEGTRCEEHKPCEQCGPPTHTKSYHIEKED